MIPIRIEFKVFICQLSFFKLTEKEKYDSGIVTHSTYIYIKLMVSWGQNVVFFSTNSNIWGIMTGELTTLKLQNWQTTP